MSKVVYMEILQGAENKENAVVSVVDPMRNVS